MVLIPSRTLTLFSPECAASLDAVFSPMGSDSPAPKAMCLEVPNGGSEAPSRIQFARQGEPHWIYGDPSSLSDDELLRLAGPVLLALTDGVLQRVLEGHCLRRKNREISKSNLFRASFAIAFEKTWCFSISFQNGQWCLPSRNGRCAPSLGAAYVLRAYTEAAQAA